MKQHCPCHSKKEYAQCCKPYHEGKAADDAVTLMRSRYSAYAKGLTQYIIATTHKDNPSYNENILQWKNELLVFKREVQFVGLEILDIDQKENEAYVTFHAKLLKKKKDISFIEKSYFVKLNGKWLYHSGEIQHSP